MAVQPLQNERRPTPPIRWEQPKGSFPYKVQDNDTWASVAQQFNVKDGGPRAVPYLIFFNFYVFCDIRHMDAAHSGVTDEVNWYLREYVGCNVSKDGGRNWAFSASADPGIIYIPIKTIDFEGDGLVVIGSKGVGTNISVPQYDDSNFYDVISKAIDIYGQADLAVGVSEVALPALVEGGMIVASPLVAVAGEFVAMGAGDNAALRYWNREYFFEGFSVGLVMSANGAGKGYIIDHGYWKYHPLNSKYPEKAETFRKVHNAGLELGIRQGKKFSTVDQYNFFYYLHSQLSTADQAYFSPKTAWKDWSVKKIKDYYDTLSTMIKRKMIDNNLQLKIVN